MQNKLQLEAVTNLISVGDSHIEMDAVHLLGRSFAHALVKTVKLWERPTPYELVAFPISPSRPDLFCLSRAPPRRPVFCPFFALAPNSPLPAAAFLTRHPCLPAVQIKQLEVVKEKLPEIYRSGTTLNIWLERESSVQG